MDKRSLKRKLGRLTTEILGAYKSGTSSSELAKYHKCSPNTIRRILKENGVTMRRPGRRKGVSHSN